MYFDDFKVEHVKSSVIQSQDYYPFGLTFGTYQRENSLNNSYQYNGKEQQDEMNLGWLDYGQRMYLPEIGRFFQQDRFAEKYLDFTPYQYGANSPINYVDINGDSLTIPTGGQSTLDSMRDLFSLIKNSGVTLHMSANGSMSLIFEEGMSEEDKEKLIGGDAGLSLLSDLISVTKNYFYEAGTKEQARDRDTGESLASEENPKYGESYMIRNLSTTPRNIDGGIGPSDFTVDIQRNGKQYDGHVRITNAPGEFYQQYTNGGTRTIERASVVFHELAENYGRTHFNKPYEGSDGSGAHQYANNREWAGGNPYGNDHPSYARFRKQH